MIKTKLLFIAILITLLVFTARAEDAVQAPAKTVDEVPPPEPPRIQITIAKEAIDAQMKAYKGDIKDIVLQADCNLKKIDAELKADADKKTAAEKLNSGDKLVAEGKYLEADAEYKIALTAAATPVMKRTIKDKQRAIASKVKEAPVKESPSKSETQAVTEKPAEKIPQPVTEMPPAQPVKEEPPKVVERPAPSAEVSALYKEAVALYWDNKFSEAQAKFEKIQKESPNYERTTYYLGRIKEKK